MPIVISTSDSAKLEPKRKNRFIVSFDAVPGGGNANALAFACFKGAKPQVTFGDTELSRVNEKWKFAGKPTWNDISFSFYDYITSNGRDSAFSILK